MVFGDNTAAVDEYGVLPYSAQRKPKSLNCLSGAKLERPAQREKRTSWRQEPPRAARRVPEVGPNGLRSGEFA